jgi:hypothetical protein
VVDTFLAVAVDRVAVATVVVGTAAEKVAVAMAAMYLRVVAAVADWTAVVDIAIVVGTVMDTGVAVETQFLAVADKMVAAVVSTVDVARIGLVARVVGIAT